jgi:hypothetical protein
MTETAIPVACDNCKTNIRHLGWPDNTECLWRFHFIDDVVKYYCKECAMELGLL